MFFSDYLDISEAYIPSTQNRYRINISGEIYDSLDRKILEPIGKTEEKFFQITDESGNIHLLKQSVIVSLAFKKCQLPSYLWEKLDVSYIDEDLGNFHPSNTVWRFPDDGIEYSLLPGFYYIPGYSRYVINKKGFVFDIERSLLIAPRVPAYNYPTVSITSDLAERRSSAFLHRLLALTFLKYPTEVDRYDVNHIDGIKTNFNLENLEWATRKRNCDHAYENGLRNDNIPIQIKDIFSGDVFEFYSDSDCNKYFGLKLGASRYRAKSQGQKIYDFGVLIREKGCGKEWKEIKDPISEVIKDTKRIPIEVISVETGITKIYPNASAAADDLGLARSSVRYFLRRLEGKSPAHGYYLKIANIENLNKSFFDVIRKKKTPLTAGKSR